MSNLMNVFIYSMQEAGLRLVVIGQSSHHHIEVGIFNVSFGNYVNVNNTCKRLVCCVVVQCLTCVFSV